MGALMKILSRFLSWLHKDKNVDSLDRGILYASNIDWLPAELERMRRPDFSIACPFKIWRTIKVGNYKTLDALTAAAEESGVKIGFYCSAFEPQLLGVEESIDLFLVSNYELGRPQGCTLRETIDLAMDAGLSLCPYEVGFQLAIQYQDQPKGEQVGVISEPINQPDPEKGIVGGPFISKVGHADDNTHVIEGFFPTPWTFQVGQARGIFCRRR